MDLKKTTGFARSASRTIQDWIFQRRSELALLPALARQTLPAFVRQGLGFQTTLAEVLARNAATLRDELALEMGEQRLSFAELDARVSRVAHVVRAAGVQAGDSVALVGANSITYLTLVLGIARAGGAAALVNYNLKGELLARAILTAKPKLVIAEQEFMADCPTSLRVIAYGPGELEELCTSAPSSSFAQVPVRADDAYVYIYTSGTTGLPKACRITHGRALTAAALFGAVTFRFGKGDKLYCVLPLYHSSGLLIGVGGCLVARVPIVLRRKFSASEFWSDVRRYDATALLYIGELCRALVNQPPSKDDRAHRVRVAVGNGMNAEVWRRFNERFGVSQIREFYAATESPSAIINFTGRVGSVGHIPFRRIRGFYLARFDTQSGELERDASGRCIECQPGEVGELLMRLRPRKRDPFGGFPSYGDETANLRKLIRDVFRRGDAFFRSGDLMRADNAGHFQFVDRVGDTFRWKGENVSTSEVEEVVAKLPNVRAAAVQGVKIPGLEGKAGLCAIVGSGAFDDVAFWRAVQALPSYAQPRFVRIARELAMTGTFKLNKQELEKQGVDPNQLPDPVFLRTEAGYVPLTPELWNDVICGRVRL